RRRIGRRRRPGADRRLHQQPVGIDAYHLAVRPTGRADQPIRNRAGVTDEHFLIPRYGEGSLADLLPSVLACLGAPGETDRVGLDLEVDRVRVLLVDGLGARALAAEAVAATFLSSLPEATLTSGFPSTTAT